MSVSVDFVVLLGVLAPLVGALVVLVADVIWPRQQRLPYVLAFVSLLVAVWAPYQALAQGRGDTTSTLCLPGQPTAVCLYSVSSASAGITPSVFCRAKVSSRTTSDCAGIRTTAGRT